jgi:protocatechuate 3,4-dioxygenase beta subunit
MREEHDHDGGLRVDLPRLLGRRRALALLGGAAAVLLVGCKDDATTASAAATGAQAPIPSETAGPFPGDGSNGPDALTQSGVVRQDLRSSFGGLTGTATGTPLVLALHLVDAATGSPLAGAAVYAWHADAQGRYSMYDLPQENYLRGVQPTGADGVVAFTTVFPGCYAGRWPHIHFEVYRDVASATKGGKPLATSQVALPQAACQAVYASSEYPPSLRNLGQVSLARDLVFGDDGAVRQLATMAGTAGNGLTASLLVPVRTA